MKSRKTQPYLRETDFVDALSRPHTLIAAAFTIGIILMARAVLTVPSLSNFRNAFYASCGVFLAFCGVYLPDSILIRPHPIIWRITLGMGVLYMMLMTFLLFLDTSSARAFFAVLDPSLGKPLEERLYATDCSIACWADLSKIRDAMFDEFVIAHALGYWVKMMVMRDFWTVMALSLGFEVIECTLQYWLENFKECWWDHLLLDVFGCNMIGMVLGYLTLRYLKMKEYSWVKLHNISGFKKKAIRITMQFTPRDWEVQKWTFFNNPLSSLQVFFVTGTILIQEANVFLLKYLLWIPPTHPFVIARVCMFGILAIPAVRDFYCFCREDSPHRRLGPSAWVCCTAIFIETAVIIRYGKETGAFSEALPVHVRVAWVFSAVSWVIWFLLRYWGHAKSKHRPTFCKQISWIFFFSPFAAFLLMCCMSTPGMEDFRRYTESIFLKIPQQLLKL